MAADEKSLPGGSVRNFASPSTLSRFSQRGTTIMKGIALWALGIPIPIIILLYIFHVL